MSQIAITLVRADTNQEFDVELPDDHDIAGLLPALVKELGLPLTGPDGNQVAYEISNKRTGREYKEADTLGSVGTKTGDVILLTSTFVAGGVWFGDDGDGSFPPERGAVEPCHHDFRPDKYVSDILRCVHCGLRGPMVEISGIPSNLLDAVEGPRETFTTREGVDIQPEKWVQAALLLDDALEALAKSLGCDRGDEIECLDFTLGRHRSEVERLENRIVSLQGTIDSTASARGLRRASVVGVYNLILAVSILLWVCVGQAVVWMFR